MELFIAMAYFFIISVGSYFVLKEYKMAPRRRFKTSLDEARSRIGRLGK